MKVGPGVARATSEEDLYQFTITGLRISPASDANCKQRVR
jgi:hypothetical protein